MLTRLCSRLRISLRKCELQMYTETVTHEISAFSDNGDFSRQSNFKIINKYTNTVIVMSVRWWVFWTAVSMRSNVQCSASVVRLNEQEALLRLGIMRDCTHTRTYWVSLQLGRRLVTSTSRLNSAVPAYCYMLRKHHFTLVNSTLHKKNSVFVWQMYGTEAKFVCCARWDKCLDIPVWHALSTWPLAHSWVCPPGHQTSKYFHYKVWTAQTWRLWLVDQASYRRPKTSDRGKERNDGRGGWFTGRRPQIYGPWTIERRVWDCRRHL